jgi:integrase/recombinase XerD
MRGEVFLEILKKVEEFEKYLRTRTNLSERTILKYVSDVKNFLLKYEPTIENMNNEIKKAPHRYWVFKKFLEFEKREEDAKNLIKIKREKSTKGTYLAKEELLNIVNAIRRRKYRIAALIQFSTGARAAEVLSISKENVEFDGTFTFIKIEGKGGKHRKLFISKDYVDEIVSFILGSGFSYPFLDSNEKDVKRLESVLRSYWYFLKEAAKALGYEKFSTHDFRRNFIERFYDKTKDIVLTKVAAGHSKLDTTFTYINKREKEKKVGEILEEGI